MHTAIDGLTRSLHLVSRKTSLQIAHHRCRAAARFIHASSATMHSDPPSKVRQVAYRTPHRCRTGQARTVPAACWPRQGCQPPPSSHCHQGGCCVCTVLKHHLSSTPGRRPARRTAGGAPRNVELPIPQRRLSRIRRTPGRGWARGSRWSPHGRGTLRETHPQYCQTMHPGSQRARGDVGRGQHPRTCRRQAVQHVLRVWP